MTLPPPTATITSGVVSRPSATAASTAERGTSTSASAKTAMSPASESRTVVNPGVVTMTGSVMTSTRRPCAAAIRPAADAMPTPNSTWEGARRTAKSVIGSGLQKRADEGVEFRGTLERRGVAGAAEDVGAHVREGAQQRDDAVGERDDPVLAAVDEQHGLLDLGERADAQRERVDPALPGRGEEVEIVRLGAHRLGARGDRDV